MGSSRCAVEKNLEAAKIELERARFKVRTDSNKKKRIDAIIAVIEQFEADLKAEAAPADYLGLVKGGE